MSQGSASAVRAPVALFAYNRPSHTRRTIEALAKNEFADQTDLFIFSDAAKSAAAVPAVAEVREMLAKVHGFRSVEVVERAANLGLAASIVDGVGRLCAAYGRVIVMEDDLVTSPHFLRFMNEALEFYADQDRVMHISGSTYPVRQFGVDDSYFMHLPLCWGWATWQRAWRHFRKDIAVMDRFDAQMIRAFNFNGSYDYWSQLELNRNGSINTWFVFWYATLFLEQGLSLFPAKSLVRNIGMDGSGVHRVDSSDFEVEPSRRPIHVAPIQLRTSGEAYRMHEDYFRRVFTPSAGRRGIQRFRRILRRLWNGAAHAAG